MAIIYDLYINAGESFFQQFDLAGDQTNVTVRGKAVDSIGTVTTLTCTWIDASQGTFRIEITDEITATMSNGLGYYDIELEDTSGGVIRAIKGRVYVDKEITV